MCKIFGVLLSVMLNQCLGDCATDETKLISTFWIHRHGDRTPVEATVSLSSNPEAVEAASAKYGYGQLSDVGKQHSYELGQFIRARYDELLSPQYNRSEIYIRSTDSTRTKMTVLTAMAAVYPSYPGSWSDEINWVPTPFTTVPAKYDFNLPFLNCPRLMTAYNSLLSSESTRLSKYSNVLKNISEDAGFNSATEPLVPYVLYDVYVSQLSLGIPLNEKIACVLSELEEAANVAMDVIYGNPEYLALQAGVILNEFITQAESLIRGVDTPRVRVYSAHDANVYSLMAAAQVTPRQGVPGYAAAFALELREMEKTGQHVVLPVYLESPKSKPTYLSVVGCERPCGYEQFKKIVSKYTLDEESWRTACDFTQDFQVEESTIA